MRPSLDGPRGARYLTPAVVAPQRTAALPIGLARGVLDHIEPHRLALMCLVMVTTAPTSRIDRGLARIFVDAATSMPPISVRAAARGKTAATGMHDALLALPVADRMPTMLAVAYALHESAPITETWRNVARALDRIGAGVTITEAHETSAASIVADALRVAGVR